MNIYLSSEFIKNFKRLTRRNPSLKNKIKEKLTLFQNNPLHPSLRIHKLVGKREQSWSISVEKDLRIIFIFVKDGVLLIDIGKHDKVY